MKLPIIERMSDGETKQWKNRRKETLHRIRNRHRRMIANFYLPVSLNLLTTKVFLSTSISVMWCVRLIFLSYFCLSHPILFTISLSLSLPLCFISLQFRFARIDQVKSSFCLDCVPTHSTVHSSKIAGWFGLLFALEISKVNNRFIE